MSGQGSEYSPAVRPGEDAVSAVKLSQPLTAMIDTWAEAHHLTRTDAISRLLEIALAVSPPTSNQDHSSAAPLVIEREAIRQIEEMLDPALPADERERRIRRLTEGPPEFSKQRVDLPKHQR